MLVLEVGMPSAAKNSKNRDIFALRVELTPHTSIRKHELLY